MKLLANFVVSEIEKRVQQGFHSSPEFRPIVSGIPYWLMHDAFSILVQNGGVQISQDGHVIPVFLVNSQAPDPSHITTTECTTSYLVAVRNKLASFLTLCPKGESIPKSMTSAMSPLDFTSNDVVDAVDWISQRLVRDAMEFVIGRFTERDQVGSLFQEAISDVDELDKKNGDDDEKWRLLERFYERAMDIRSLTLCLGFPNATSSQVGNAEHRSVIRKLAEYIETAGLNRGFESLIEKASSKERRDSLAHAQQHIIERCESAADRFAIAPTYFYAPPVAEPPTWWLHLDVDAWSELLENPTEEEDSAELHVTPTGMLSRPTNGMPFCFSDTAIFEIQLASQSQSKLTISRAVGQKSFEVLDELLPNGELVTWVDDSPPSHDKFLRYRFEMNGAKPITLKVVVLNQYSAGVYAFAKNAKKCSQFSWKKGPKSGQGKNVEMRYECDLELTSMGTQQLDLFIANGFTASSEILGYGSNADDDEDNATAMPVNLSKIGHAVCLIDVDEECFYDLRVEQTDGKSIKYRFWIRADDIAPLGACSEFERLVIENRSSKEREAARVEVASSRLLDLEAWLLEDLELCYPTVLGLDYLSAWRRPSVENDSLISNFKFVRDCRVSREEFVLPPNLRQVRVELLQILKAESKEDTHYIEKVQLCPWARDSQKRKLLEQYFQSYGDWLADNYENAAWMDIITVHRSQDDHVLETYPHAILISPLHPLRLAWQVRAQDILQNAIDDNRPCPCASLLDPTAFPDCFALPCKTATGGIDYRQFVSVRSSSDYWSVLWSVADVTNLDQKVSRSVFTPEFGLEVDGLSAGFSTAQVERSLDEVRRIASGKSSLSVVISSDTTGSSSCNEGIENWCARNLGSNQDPWFHSGASTLEVFDERDASLHPEPSTLSSLTEKTDSTVSWYRAPSPESISNDLSVIAHLGCDSPEFSKENLQSPIDPSGLFRSRIRRQIPQANGTFLAESRVGRISSGIEWSDEFSKFVVETTLEFENQCSEKCGNDSYVFAPRLQTLERALKKARYCAVSSTNVDPACFFGPVHGSYLWDYELPALSRRVGESSGFYLLASEQPSMLMALQSSLLNLGHAEVEIEALRSLLAEISKRGMPTLRRLTAGGSAALGELGLLLALRLLQSDFSTGKLASIFPAKEQALFANFIVPVDPFQAHLDSLRSSLRLQSRERPDLIAISIGINAGLPFSLKITPIEVKTRTNTLSETDRTSALRQATELSALLSRIKQEAKKSELWGIAWRHLISTWLTYAFRVYSKLDQFSIGSEWANLHSRAIELVSSNSDDIEIDCHGRLISIEESGITRLLDVDNDGFKETIQVTKSDAASLLLDNNNSLRDKIVATVGTWELLASSSLVEEVAPISPDYVEETTDSEAIDATNVVKAHETPHSEAASEASVGVKFSVGKSMEAIDARELYFEPSNTNLTQLNIGIVGNLGTGKTQLLKALLYNLNQSAANNRNETPRILIFDYKKDYSDAKFVNAVKAKIVKPCKIPLNLFDTSACTNKNTPWLERAKFFIDVLDKIYSNIGPVQKQKLKQAIKVSYEEMATSLSGQSVPTIYDVFRIYEKECEGSIDTPYSIMSDMIDMELFDPKVDNHVPFADFFQGVTVINLGDLGQDDRSKNMLVAILLNLFYEHMLNIKKREFIGTAPSLRFVDSLLLVDEADNIMQYEFDVLRRILLQGREFGVGVILASQYLSHFKTKHEDYREPLLSWFIHQVPNVTVKELEAIGIPNADAAKVSTIKKLQCHECLYKSLGVDSGEFMRGHPFFELFSNQDTNK